jgi:integrase
VFRAAVKRKLIASNPFADVLGRAVPTTERQRFVTREETGLLLEACPNVDWRVIVALCRFGGLRSPSEVLSLRWQDVNWERQRMRVRSPKTEHHVGKASRETPLFPELAAVLTEAFEAAPEGAVYVVADNTYREAADTSGGWKNCNMRTQFGRIIPRPCGCGLVGKHAEDCPTPLLDDHGNGLCQGRRPAGRKGGAESGAAK